RALTLRFRRRALSGAARARRAALGVLRAQNAWASFWDWLAPLRVSYHTARGCPGWIFAPLFRGGSAAGGGAMSKTYSLKGKVSRQVALVIAEELVKQLPDTQIVGSLRRGCEVVGDVDLLTTSPAAMGLLPMLVDEVFVRGAAKVSGRKGEIQVDLNLTTVEAMGSALMHHTGSAGFNIMCRSRAIRLGYSLSQH